MLQLSHILKGKHRAFTFIVFLFSYFTSVTVKAQIVDELTILTADKKFINTDYLGAAHLYERYLKHKPEDFYTIRQIARCYTYLNNPDMAIDYWTKVYENSKANDGDRLEYARCLMANYRTDAARQVLYSLKNSKDPLAAAWAKTYSNSEYFFYEDTAMCRVYAINGFITTQSESSPYLYKSELIYVSVPKGSSPQKHKSSIFSSIRIDSTTWKKGKVFNPQIQGKTLNGAVCISGDDSVIYFTSHFTAGEMKKRGYSDGMLRTGIFSTQINSYGFANPEKTPLAIGSVSCNVAHPAITRDGKKMYFASDMSGGLGGYDIWVSIKNNGVWGPAENLGANINTIGNDMYPFITEDGVLYFSSDGRPGMGCLDIFSADPANEEGKFLEAENAGAGMNSQYNDFGVFIYDNHRRGYFSSNRDKGGLDDDLYFFSSSKPRSFEARYRILDTAEKKSVGADVTLSSLNGTIGQRVDSGAIGKMRIKPGQEITITTMADNYVNNVITKTVSLADTLFDIYMVPKFQRCIEGKIIDKESNTPIAGAKVAIYDEDGNNYLNIETDASGAYKMCKLPMEKDLYIGAAKKPDYFANTERFRITKGNDIVKNILTQKIVVGKAIKIDNIYFDPSKFDVREDAKPELDKLVNLMKDNPDIIIELSSHTDCKGAAAANLLLSDKRAKASANYIIKKGISKDRVKGKGYGETKLLNDCGCEGSKVSTCSDDQHAVNRRTEFKVTGFVQAKKK